MKNLAAAFFPLSLLLSAIRLSQGSDGSIVDETGCPGVFRRRCHCGRQFYRAWKPNEQVFVVNCTNAGFTDTAMLELLPNGTQVLLFNGNNIPHMDWNVLGVWDPHEKLEVLDLTNNRITDITGKSFHRVKYVKRLILDHNNIKISGQHFHRRLLTNFESLEELHLTNAFTEVIDSKWYLDDLKDILLASNMTKLYKLHLEQNEIWSITNDTFCYLPALSDLYLGDNQLSDLDFNFECIQRLRFLDIQANKIKRLDLMTMRRIDSVFAGHTGKKINLNLNPWVCDCHLSTFHDWISKSSTRLFQPDKLRCYKGYPEINAGRKILNIQTLDCPQLDPSDETGSGGQHQISSKTNALLTVLIVLIVLLLALVLYINRTKVRGNIQPLVASFQRSMQYSTIKEAFNDPPGSDASSPRTTAALPTEVNI